jgi:hypothetical protein
MKRICTDCLNIFEVFQGDTMPEYCPLANCDGYDLVEIDDQMVDVIRGLWARGVGTKYCCSGHLYERSMNAYLVFDGFYTDLFEIDLAGFRDLLVAVNGEDSRVAIEEVEARDDGEIFVVRSVCGTGEMSPKQKLKCQVGFVEFFYDVFARMDVLYEEIVKHDDESVMETDIAET